MKLTLRENRFTEGTENKLLKIAQQSIAFMKNRSDLERHQNGEEDFFEIDISELKDALIAAYELGASEKLGRSQTATEGVTSNITEGLDGVINYLTTEVQDQVNNILTGPDFGFEQADIDDFVYVTVASYDHTYARIEVRAELSYKGLTRLMDALDKWVTQYDTDAYFDADDAGITSALINMRKVKALIQ